MVLRITEVLNTKKEYEEIFKLQKPVIPAMLCDAEGLVTDSGGNSVSAQLASNPNYVWVRSYAEATPQPVLNMNTVPPVTGTPVYIGWPEGAQEIQILGINKEALSEESLIEILTGHAQQHEPGGFDPLYLYRRNFASLRSYASNTLYNGLEISISSLEYDDNNGERAFYPGESGFDLTAYLPAAGNKKWILIYLDITTNTINIAEGAEVLNVAPINAIKPDTPANGISSAYVLLTSGMVDVTENDIEDGRRFLNTSSKDGAWPFPGEIKINRTYYDTLQTAINAAVTGDEIKIGSGTYTFTAPLTIEDKQITIVGASDNSTIFNFDGGTYIADLSINADDTLVRFQNIKFSTSTFDMTNGFNLTDGSTLEFKNCIVNILGTPATGLDLNEGYVYGYETSFTIGTSGYIFNVIVGEASLYSCSINGDVYSAFGKNIYLYHCDFDGFDYSGLYENGGIEGDYFNVNGVITYPQKPLPSDGDAPVWDESVKDWVPQAVGGGGNVWPKASQANISDTPYTNIDTFFDALLSGVQGIIGEWQTTTDQSGGHANVPTGADVKGSGVGVTILTSADSNGTIVIEGQSLIEQMTVENTDTTNGLCIGSTTGVDARFDTVKCISESASGYNQGFYIFDGNAELINCEAYCAGGGTNDYAVWAYDNGSGTLVTIRKGYFDGDVVADQAGAVIHLDGPTITGNVTEQNSGVITGHYYDSSGRLCRGSDQSIVYATVPNTNSNDIYQGTSLSVSDFVATIATLPGGATLTYNAPSSGDEANLVPTSTSQIAKMVLHNTTRGDDALISNCNTGTNTITLTAAVPGTWVVGDTLTIRSQTNTSAFGSAYFVDFQFVSGIQTDSEGIFLRYTFLDTGGTNVTSAFHPYEANNNAKRIVQRTAVINIGSDSTIAPLPIDLTTRRFCLAWNASGSNTIQLIVRLTGELKAVR